MLIKTRVFACQQRCGKKRRDLIERHAQAIRAGKTAVNLSIDIENGVALRHGAHLFHVETGGPRAVENEKGQTSRPDQADQADFPTVAKKFALPGPGEKFHSNL